MKQSHREYLALQAWLHLSHNRVEESIVILEGMALLLPADLWVHRTLAYAYLCDQQFSRCLEHLDRHVRSQAQRADRLMRLRALWGLGRHSEARQMLADLQGRLKASES